MAEPCARVRLNDQSRRRLWAESGGYCGNPACRVYLFPDDLDVDFAELAHIIPALPNGPRAVPIAEVSLEDRAQHRNIILLCANCHTTIDKAPGSYPAEQLQGWKTQRDEEIKAAIGTPTVPTRAEAREYVQGLLNANKAIHSRYGPTGEPYTEGNPTLWRRHARATIVPNNRKILRFIEANRRLLTQSERDTLAIYQLHVQQFEDRHVLDDFTAGTERFPEAMSDIFLDDTGGMSERS